jgi:dTDP-4-amino-4,6-dideoxygalactose transaminase
VPGYYKLGFQYYASAFGGLPRELLARSLRAEGIAIDPGFRALHRVHSRRRYRTAGELPCADAADEEVLVLHHPVLLGSEADVRQVVAAVHKIRKYAKMIRATLER